MKSMIKVGAFALILCVMMMSGCLDSDEEATSITNILGNPTTKDVVYSAELILDHSNPGTMEVEMYVDDTAKIVTTTGSGEVIETGTWQLYRESPDHSLYDIITDDTELRMAFRDSNQQAIAYIYHDGFTRWDDSFYGVWELINEYPIEEVDDEPVAKSTTRPNPDDLGRPDEEQITLHFDATLISGRPGDPVIWRIVMETDRTLELCDDITGVNDCTQGTWKPFGTASQYDMDVEAFPDVRITIIPDGKARFCFDESATIQGTWERS